MLTITSPKNMTSSAIETPDHVSLHLPNVDLPYDEPTGDVQEDPPQDTDYISLDSSKKSATAISTPRSMQGRN